MFLCILSVCKLLRDKSKIFIKFQMKDVASISLNMHFCKGFSGWGSFLVVWVTLEILLSKQKLCMNTLLLSVKKLCSSIFINMKNNIFFLSNINWKCWFLSCFRRIVSKKTDLKWILCPKPWLRQLDMAKVFKSKYLKQKRINVLP